MDLLKWLRHKPPKHKNKKPSLLMQKVENIELGIEEIQYQIVQLNEASHKPNIVLAMPTPQGIGVFTEFEPFELMEDDSISGEEGPE